MDWQRSCVRTSLEEGSYLLDTEVDIAMMVDYKALYKVGSGRLVHNADGFHLTGCDGALDFSRGPVASHSLNADFFWYEIGDVVYIGNSDVTYCCVPKTLRNVVAKTRLAAEELYKIKQNKEK
jgi:hypothetical protein